MMRTIVPMPCMQCKIAPCVENYPMGVSIRSAGGIVIGDKETRIGCQTCIEACPYGDCHSCDECDVLWLATHASAYCNSRKFHMDQRCHVAKVVHSDAPDARLCAPAIRLEVKVSLGDLEDYLAVREIW